MYRRIPPVSTEGNMIHLTRLNNASLIVNSDLIKFVEQSPDTVITLLNGEKIIVREHADQILERIVAFRRAVLQGLYSHAGDIPAVAAADNRAVTAPEAAER